LRTHFQKVSVLAILVAHSIFPIIKNLLIILSCKEAYYALPENRTKVTAKFGTAKRSDFVPNGIFH